MDWDTYLKEMQYAHAEQIRLLEHELLAVDEALRAEHCPAKLTRMGQIRWLGDQRRKAERKAAGRAAKAIEEYKSGRCSQNTARAVLGFEQMDVYDCIEEVKRERID